MTNDNSVDRARNRRSFLKAAGSVGVVATFAGCSGEGGGGETTDGGDGTTDAGGAATTTQASIDGPLKIGRLIPLSGAFALTGQEIRRGTEMAREHLGGSVMGADIEFVTRDTQTEPSAALEGAKALVQQEDVHAIIGPAGSSMGLSVIPYIRDQGQVPLLPTQVSSTKAREGENCTEYSYFIWPSNRHTVPVGADFIFDLPDLIDREFDPSQAHFFAPDYALGQNNLELSKQAFSERGGEITGSTMVPIGTQDLSSYLSEVSSSDADVVTGVLTPGLAVRLINQAADFDLSSEKVMMFNSGKPVDQITQSSVGSAADGWFGTAFYNPVAESDINTAFKDLYPSDSDLLPNSSCGSGFETVRALAAAAERAGSADSDALVDELGGLSWESIFGSATFREGDGQTELDFVGATRNESQFEVLEEYPDIIGPNNC